MTDFLESEPADFWRGLIDIAAGEGHDLRVGYTANGDDESIEILGSLPPELRCGLKRVVPFWEPIRRGQMPWRDYAITWALDPAGNGPRFGIVSVDELIGLLGARRLMATGTKTTLTYTEANKQRLRPNAEMPREAHAKIGAALKIVYIFTFGQCGVTRPVHRVRCELDNWHMLEHGSELSDHELWTTYFGQPADDDLRIKSPQEKRQQYVCLLKEVKITLTAYYYPCFPLLEILRLLDQAIDRLEVLHAR